MTIQLTILGFIKPGSHERRKHKQENKAMNDTLGISKTKKKEFSIKFAFVLLNLTLKVWSLCLALMSMFMSHTSLHFFVSSFVLARAYACVAGVNQALGS